MANIIKQNKRNNVIDELYQYDKDDFDNLLKLPKIASKMAGIRLDCEDKGYMRSFWRVYFWVNFCGSLSGGWLLAVDVMDTLTQGHYNDCFLLMPCCGFTFVGLSKTYNIARHKPVFENLISELRAMWPLNAITKEEHNIIKDFIRHYSFVSKGYFWCNIFMIFFFVQLPYVNGIKHLLGQDTPKLFAFSYWLPFDQFRPGYYEAIVVHQTLACYFAVIVTLSADLLFFFLSSTIAAQLELLSVNIHRLIHVPIDDQLMRNFPLGEYSASNKTIDDSIDKISAVDSEDRHLNSIRRNLMRHQALICLAGDVESMFTFSMMVNFVNSSMIICFCGFCCVYVEKWNEFRYKFLLSSAMSQVWILCWYGQQLLDSSEKVADALYNCGWYSATKKIKSSILIMLNRSQREVHVTTYGFSVICLASYTTIMKTAWSYFTLLINSYNP